MIDIGITRSRSNKMLLGVCGGIAAHLGVSSKLIRVATLVLAIIVPGVSFIAVLIAYIALGFLLPDNDSIRA
ncbi:MAG: PspC domain-containing protein [Thermomicrobiales bacterium]